MPYLTQTEYEEMGFAKISGPYSFDQLLNRATGVLDNITRHYYHKADISSDNPFRSKQFKKALGTQIEYLFENKAMTSNKINNRPNSVSMGRTSLNYGSSRSDGKSAEKSLICPDVYSHLEGTGLLNRGV